MFKKGRLAKVQPAHCGTADELPTVILPMSDALPFLVYRDRIAAPSEVGFLRRQYCGFSHLRPVWTGRTVLPDAALLGAEVMRLGGDGILGPLHRLMFRHFGIVPGYGRYAPILHAQFARGGALALPLARTQGMRLTVTLHGGDISKRKNWQGTVLARRWPALVETAVRFICVSQGVAEIAAARGVPAAKLAVLPIGVEVPDQPPVDADRARPGAHLFVGRFVEKKGIAVLADAVRRLRATGDATPLICVGDGPLRPVLEALARDVPGVQLTGWQAPDAVQALMRHAISLIVPSIVAANGDEEGLPSVIPEAMAQGCPVIGSQQGGIAEALQEGETGLLVAPGDAADLARAMRELAAAPDRRAALGLAGYRHAAETLNARVQSRKLEAMLLADMHNP